MRGNLFGIPGIIQKLPRLKPAVKWKLLEHQRHCVLWSKFAIEGSAQNQQFYV